VITDRSPRRPEEFEAAIGVPVVGAVPRMGPQFALGDSDWGTPSPELMYSALRNLHACLLTQGDGPVQTIMITSSLADEGKTETAINFARMLATTGRKVLLIDADLRRPSVHGRLGLRSAPGVGEALAGPIANVAPRAVQLDDMSGLAVLTAGNVFVDVADFGRTGRIAELLEWAVGEYQIVVLDSAPVLGAAETALLAGHVHSTVFLVRSGRTTLETARRGLRVLADSGARVAGVTLSLVGRRDLLGYNESAGLPRLRHADRLQ
jgi:Mrp family chromosome partitioning ATPase